MTIDRRSFLTTSGRLALAAGLASQTGWLAGCASAVKPREPGTAAWAALARSLRGRLFRPWDSGYAQLALPFDLRYTGTKPAGIAQVADAGDVATAIAWARQHGVDLVARAGGHSYGGFSTIDGLHIDLTAMNRVTVDRDSGLAVVAGGARNQDLYAQLMPAHAAISAGRCITVGVAGLALGGGFGFSSRKLGLTADAMVETELVTADGRHLTCNERENSELFWACRGGGGGNFGINTSFTFQTTPIGEVVAFVLRWEEPDSAALFDAFEDIMAVAPDAFSLRLGIVAPNPLLGTPAGVRALGQFFGSQADLEDLLAPAFAVARPDSRLLRPMGFFEAKDLLAVGAEPEFNAERSRIANAPLPAAGVETLVAQLARWPGGTGGAQVAVFAWGGAINAKPAEATAFVHRDAFSVNSIQFAWGHQDDVVLVQRGLAWLDETFYAMQPFVSEHSYQNFIDPQLKDPLQAYYGANLPRLVSVKAAIDPDNVFHSPQSIPPQL